jgi:hypothetical protein
MGKPGNDLIWFEIEPDDPKRPGQINLRASAPQDDARYIDRLVTAVGFGIYLGGYHVYCKDLEVPVFVPDGMVDFGLGIASEASNEIFDSADQARAAAAASQRQPAVAYFVGAGGAVVAPTRICPATAPQLVATMLEARQMLGKAVADELTVLAISLVGGMIIRAVVSRIVGVQRGGKVPPNKSAGAIKIRAKNDKINVGGALEKGSEQYTNLNPVNPNSGGATKSIPNHVQAPFEEIGDIFQPDTVVEIISNRLRYVDVKDWRTAARGAFKVLRPGGRLGSGHPASGMNVWAEEKEVASMIKAFQDAGFKDVRNVGSKSGPGVVIAGIKP